MVKAAIRTRADRDPGQRRQVLAAAERVEVAAEAGVVLDDDRDEQAGERQPDAPGKAEEALDGERRGSSGR